MTCSICLEELKEENTFLLDDCKHIFHIKCIMKWFRDGHKTCPNCRSEPEPSSSSNDFYSRIFINSILSSLANDDRYQPQYQELQTLFLSFSPIDNIDMHLTLKITKILLSLFSLKLKLKLLFSFFLSGTFIIVIIPIITTKLLFDEFIDKIKELYS